MSGGKTTGDRPQNLGLRKMLMEPDLTNIRMTRHGHYFLLCPYNARTLLKDADLHALPEVADRIKFHATALQETTVRRTIICQLNNGTLVNRVQTKRLEAAKKRI